MIAYTSLEQSKKLAEILPLETADMVYLYQGTKDDKEYYSLDCHPWADDCNSKDLPAWSLAALLDLMPLIDTEDGKTEPILSKTIRGYHFLYKSLHTTRDCTLMYNNPIDAAVEMIEWLLENNYINAIK